MELQLPFLFCILLLIFTSFELLLVASRPHNNLTDLESLLAFKADVDGLGFLSNNWTTDIDFCLWIGVSCSLHRQRVNAINLTSFNLQGTISPHLGNLSFLSKLALSNNSLYGHLPESLGMLSRLQVVDLSVNFLTGPIPSSILNMSSLTTLLLYSNNFNGSLLSNTSYPILPSIEFLDLHANQLSGNFLAKFMHCYNLIILNLFDNELSGTIPVEIGRMHNLVSLHLKNNMLSGTIPSSLGNLTNLEVLILAQNNFIGEIPVEFGNLANLQRISIWGAENLTGSIPTSLLNATNLSYIRLYENKLTGSIPVNIGNSLPLLQVFDVSDNQLTGGIEFLPSFTNCRDLHALQIGGNSFVGMLPESIGNLSTSLKRFNASRNYIMGNIPSAVGNLTGLTMFDIYDNNLTGSIPSSLGKLYLLGELDLSFNNLSGSIPFELGLLANLVIADLTYNELSGQIPNSFANISMVQHLCLSHNNLSSSIPENLWSLGSLIELDLSRNFIQGVLSPQVGNLEMVFHLDLSGNQLSGNIPNAFDKLQMLQVLDLSRNSFQGQIPESFGNLVSISNLNLSYNSLSGLIPKSLAGLRNLNSIDLSFNELTGQVPNGRVFDDSSIPLLVGNEALCGAPQLNIPSCTLNTLSDDSRRKSWPFKYIMLTTILGDIFLVLFCFICTIYFKRRTKLHVVSLTRLDDHRAVSYHELVRATNNFSQRNLLGKGAFGSVFKGCLDDGVTTAIKVFNLEVEGALKSFEAECQVLRMVRHKNLLKIINVCSNLDFKALVLEFMPNGDLENFLHSNSFVLNFSQRLNIMIDVSLALEYLHHQHPNMVLHCDLKPSNILLDDELVAHVSDFGISRLFFEDSRSMATASMPGTVGYIAPEYASTGTVSRMGDVYSFGILILETFTEKRPADDVFGEHSSLREHISNTHPNEILDIVDSRLMKDCSYTDTSPQVRVKIHQCLSTLIELGLLCSSFSPKERVPMTAVVSRLQKLKMETFSQV